MAKTVLGLMDNIDDARSAVRDLVESGIPAGDIGFMANQKHAPPSDSSEKKANQAASGAAAGAVLGGVAGLALALAPIAIPGIGALLAAGPLAAALVGAVTGGLIGGLTRLGVPEQQAQYYAEGVRRGGILITVAADNEAQADTALAVLKRRGAVDIDARAAQWKKQGWKGRFAA